jgi:hypothetical protein
MRAVIKGISNDIVDIETYFPESVDNFSLSLRVRIGLDCTKGQMILSFSSARQSG